MDESNIVSSEGHEERGVSAWFHDIEQYSVLSREEMVQLFQQLEKARISLRCIISSHPAGIADIIQKSRAVLAEKSFIHNFIMMPFETVEESGTWSAFIEKHMAQLEHLELRAKTQSREMLIREFVSVLETFSLQPRVEEAALSAIEQSLSHKQNGNGAPNTSRDVVRIRQERAQLKTVKDKIILSNLRLVADITRLYKNHLPLLDLLQEGSIGLMRAVEKFDWRL